MTSMIDEIAAIAEMIKNSQQHAVTHREVIRVEMGAQLIAKLRETSPATDPHRGMYVPKLPPGSGVPVLVNLDLNPREWQLIGTDGAVLDSGEVL